MTVILVPLAQCQERKKCLSKALDDNKWRVHLENQTIGLSENSLMKMACLDYVSVKHNQAYQAKHSFWNYLQLFKQQWLYVFLCFPAHGSHDLKRAFVLECRNHQYSRLFAMRVNWKTFQSFFPITSPIR